MVRIRRPVGEGGFRFAPPRRPCRTLERAVEVCILFPCPLFRAGSSNRCGGRLRVSRGLGPLGRWLNWQSSGLQNRRLQVRFLSALRVSATLVDNKIVPFDSRKVIRWLRWSRTSRRARSSQERAPREKKPNVFARIALFIRQVFAELRKVVTPTRQELLKYTAVVLGFVVVMMALVYGLDCCSSG